MDSVEGHLSEQAPSEEPASDNSGPNGVYAAKTDGNEESKGESLSSHPNSEESYGDSSSHQCANSDKEGLIRLYKAQSFSGKPPVSTYKKRRRWLCQQLGTAGKCKRKSNFLNFSEEELQAKSEAAFFGDHVSKEIKSRKTLDPSLWDYAKFRSSIWGHLNADEEDGSHVVVKDLEKWCSHDVLYNSRSDGLKCPDEALPRGKRIVPNQGKGWSFRERHEGKGKVSGLPCMTQPKLQLYYI